MHSLCQEVTKKDAAAKFRCGVEGARTFIVEAFALLSNEILLTHGEIKGSAFDEIETLRFR